MIKILYYTTEGEDYLQDVSLVGLRSILGASLIDFPRKDILYNNSLKSTSELYGNGFTVWKLLEDIPITRPTEKELSLEEFTHIIFGSIWRQRQEFTNLCQSLKKENTKVIVLDGEDNRHIYKPAVKPWIKYFKREMIPSKIKYDPFSLVSKVNPYNFSIPDLNYLKFDIEKSKKFATHVQCDEAYKLDEIAQSCKKSYAFNTQDDYYKDIATSKYAITMKKGGWDCMRHYEIAANGAVICFYKLDEKPKMCAPHGLLDMFNCIAFNSAEELEKKIAYIEENELYSHVRKSSLIWAKNHVSSIQSLRLL